MIQKTKSSIWVICGSLCLGVAILGVALPVLPTTPLLLLAAFCYGRGSKRFYHWLVERSWLSGYIQSYRSGLGIPLQQKIITISLLWLTIGSTILFATDVWWLRAGLAVVAVGVTTHLVRIKTRHGGAQPDEPTPASQIVE